MTRILFIMLSTLLFLSSCASTGAVYKQDYDFSKIKNVYVDDRYASTASQTIKDAVIKQLMKKGYSLKTSPNDADVIVSYAVSEYQPGKKYLIRNSGNNSHDRLKNDYFNTNGGINVNVYTNETLELSGSSVYDLGSAFGVDNANIIASNATVGVSLTMKDASQDDIIWTNSYTYEGLDLSTAVNGVVKYILKSFPPEEQGK